MTSELRKTGISVVGDVAWGAHFCYFYETKQDLLDILIPYFKTGLKNKEFCLWVVSNSELITIEEAKEALAQAVPDLDRHLSNENIEILNGHDWYLEENTFNLEKVTNAWDAKLKRALARGYEGIRVSGDTFWLREKDWRDFFAYEKQLNESITDRPMTLLCTYPLAKSGAAEVLDVVQAHQFAIARRQGEWKVIETPELIHAKAEIKKLNEELEQRVIERTNELRAANEELRKEIAERKQAEDELRQQKEILQQIFDHIPVMISFVDADGHLKLVNREWERTLGWSLEEIRRQNLDIFAECYPDPQYRQQVLKFVAEAKGEWAEFKTRARDGRVIDTTFVRSHLSDGTSIGIGKDITERKQADEALDERLRFETLVTELSAAFANLSPNEVDREIDKWLQSLVEFLGVDRATFFQLGEDWKTLYLVHSYTVPAIEPLSRPPIGLNEQFPWITDQLRQGNTIKWSRIPDDLPEQAAKEKEYAAKTGAKSVLNIPVLVGGSVICTISFTSIRIYCDWPDDLVARLRLVGEIFASALERKRAEAALRKSEEQFRQMAENIREVFWLATADLSKMLYVSPAYEAVWGRTRESLYREPRSFSAAIHDEDRARVVAIIERDREQGFEVEYRVVRPDDSIRWIRDRGFPINDESGRFYRVAGIAEDITESKRAEEELKTEKEILEKIFENIPVMIGFVGDDGVRLVNPEWERTIGWTLKELREQNVDIFAESYPDLSYRQEVLDFVAASTGEWVDLKIKVRDGRVIDAACAVVHLSDGTRVAIAQDITERKQAEEKLKQSENRLAEAQRLAHVGSFDWDLRSNTVTWSDELYRIFGLQPGEINVAGDARSFIHPQDRDLVMNTVQSSVKSKEPYSFYYRVLTPAGDERIVPSRGQILSDEHGEPMRVFGATQDITELQRAEENLKATSDQLRALSARLQSAREEEGTRIAREIHDELGSALTSLKWDLEEIDKQLSTPLEPLALVALREKFQTPMKLADLAITAIRRIASELRPSVLDDLGLAAAIEWQAQQFQARTGIICECDCSLENVELSDEQSTAVFRILQEALTNVLRHSHATKVDIKINKENGYFVLSVSDNGKGITESVKLEQQSLGILGMRERAHLIGGEIDVKGVEGKGTVVAVRVPSSGQDKVLKMTR